MAIVSIEGVTRREQAELLRGKKIGVSREALPTPPAADTYYVADLTGMAVILENGSPFGVVAAVANYGASDILEIARPNGETELYAFTQTTFPKIDASARRITINPPEILDARIDD
jgi:16S rRNA processing protein RimM